MGMFDWLYKTEKEHAKYLPESRGLPESARIAPMPECKPPKADPVPDISEPVIKLLAMLEEDVWELVNIKGFEHLVHVYKEDFKMHVLCFDYLHHKGSQWALLGYDWMTIDEAKAVNSIVSSLCGSLKLGNTHWKNSCTRNKFQQYLETI